GGLNIDAESGGNEQRFAAPRENRFARALKRRRAVDERESVEAPRLVVEREGLVYDPAFQHEVPTGGAEGALRAVFFERDILRRFARPVFIVGAFDGEFGMFGGVGGRDDAGLDEAGPVPAETGVGVLLNLESEIAGVQSVQTTGGHEKGVAG